MKLLIKNILLSCSLIAAVNATAAEKVIIGHMGDPAPVHAAIQEGRFDKISDWDIEWRKFNSGAEVIAAMASGDVQISDLGSSPLSIAVSQGVDIKIFLVSFLIGDSESLIVRADSGIEKPDDLVGKRIAVPIGSTAHLSLIGAIKHWGINPKSIKIIGMSPDQINAAWSQGAIDGAFVWNPVQSVLLENGKRLISAGEVATWGYPTFNGWVVNNRFAEKNEKNLVEFANIVNEVNAEYLNEKPSLIDDSEFVLNIAKSTGSNKNQVVSILDGFEFLTAHEQADWLDSNAALSLSKTAEFLKESGRIDKVLADYNSFVNSSISSSADK